MFAFTPGRRDLLKGGALLVGFSLIGAAKSRSAMAAGAGKSPALDEVDSFLAIHADGFATIYSGKVDLGTGVETAITQMAAEELYLPFERVNVIQGDTALTPNQGPTWGSLSIQQGGTEIRRAAATARAALLTEAAKRLDASEAELTIENGVIIGKSGKRASYADLIGGKHFSLRVNKSAPLKNPAIYTIVGQSVPRVDIPGKITAHFTYMQDFRVPGMLHGRIVRPTGVGATLESVDETSVQNIPGIVKIVREQNFLAVVAKTEWAAIKGSAQLKAVWSKWDGLPDESKLWDWVRASKVSGNDVTSNRGDATTGLASGAKTLKATYDFAMQTHGSIGPACAIAELADGKLTCWTASQDTHRLRFQLATMLGLDPANVRCIYLEGAGCYGRNGHEDAASEAALLARAVGRPVRVQWMRADAHGWDPKGPPTLIDLEGALDENGKLLAWKSEFFIPEGGGGTVPLLGAIAAKLPHKPEFSPGNITRDSAIPYTVPNVKTTCHRLARTPLRPSWIRTPGRMQNTFANESFLDEVAAAAGADPLEFRLKHLHDARGVDLLEHLAVLAKWQSRPPPKKPPTGKIATGRGISYVHYELVRTYVAAVAEVEVDLESGKIRAPRFFVVHDCGQIINPNGLKNQIEGNVIMTVSRTVVEKLIFDRARVMSLDWASYPILHFPDAPAVLVELIDRPNDPPWGAGEPTGAVIPAAISNAVFDATGARLRSVPFRPDAVKAALQAL